MTLSYMGSMSGQPWKSPWSMAPCMIALTLIVRSLREVLSVVELRCHHAGRIMRWMPQIIGKDNGAVAQIVRNNIVAADTVRK